MTIDNQRIVLEDRVKRERARIQVLINKMGAFDQQFTEEDTIELNTLKQWVMACTRSIQQLAAGQPPEILAAPRTQVFPSDSVQPESPKEPSRRSSRSRRTEIIRPTKESEVTE